MVRKKQIDESKDLIVKAFMKLLYIKDYDDISLTEIANEAGVARMTLYRHFKEKDKIVIFQVSRVYNKIINETKENSEFSFEELFSNIMKTFKELPNLKMIYKKDKLRKMITSIRRELDDELYKNLLSSKQVTLDNYSFKFLMGGIDQLTSEWILNDFSLPVEEITSRILLVVNALNSK